MKTRIGFSARIAMIIFCVSIWGSLVSAAEITQEQMEKLAASEQWRALLHMHEGKTEITDPLFYASQGPPDALDELRFLIEHHEDTSLLQRFPARYTFLYEYAGLAIPDDLYADYLHHRAFDFLSLYFASPFLGSSMSFFGHTFLTLNKDENLMFSHAISFTGNIPDGISFPALAAKGLGGTLEGRYTVSPFYTVYQKYVKQEQRQLFEYTIPLTGKQKHYLILHLKELEPIASDYSFIFNNCSTGLISLLHAVMPEEDLPSSFHSVVYPFDLPIILMEKTLAEPHRLIVSDTDNLYREYDELSAAQKGDFVSILNSTDKEQALSSYSEYERDLFSYLLNGRYDVQFKVKGNVKSDYQRVKSLTYQYTVPVISETLKDLRNRLTSCSVATSWDGENIVPRFSFTPLSTQHIQYGYSSLQSGYFEVGSLRVGYRDGHPFLEQVSLYEYESFSVLNPFLNSSSKRVFIGLIHDKDIDALRWTSEVGFGVSFNVLSGVFTILPSAYLATHPLEIGAGARISYRIARGAFHGAFDSRISLLSSEGTGIISQTELTVRYHFTQAVILEGGYSFEDRTISTGIRYQFR